MTNNSKVLRFPIRYTAAEEARRDRIVAAAERLARKGREHQQRGYDHIRLGALLELLAAVDIEAAR